VCVMRRKNDQKGSKVTGNEFAKSSRRLELHLTSIHSSGFREVLDNIRAAVLRLPKSIRRVCYVQIFAFMGWYVIKIARPRDADFSI